jgi:hypothetical protein
MKQKYSRDPEPVRQWVLEDLSKPPAHTVQGFYPMSEFAVFKRSDTAARALLFPDYLWCSPNHYNMDFTRAKQLRRLRNVIMVMEWIPDLRTIQVKGADAVQFSAQQEAKLQRAFQLFDFYQRGGLGPEEIVSVLKALDVGSDVNAEEVVARWGAGTGAITYDGFKRLMTSQNEMQKIERGRYFVLLSLQEVSKIAEKLSMYIPLQHPGNVPTSMLM